MREAALDLLTLTGTSSQQPDHPICDDLKLHGARLMAMSEMDRLAFMEKHDLSQSQYSIIVRTLSEVTSHREFENLLRELECKLTVQDLSTGFDESRSDLGAEAEMRPETSQHETEDVRRLMDYGVSAAHARGAIRAAEGDVELAANLLLERMSAGEDLSDSGTFDALQRSGAALRSAPSRDPLAGPLQYPPGVLQPDEWGTYDLG